MEKLLVTVSGGRSSAMMAILIKQSLSSCFELTFAFANTGEEHSKTLEFVHKVDVFFDLNLVWLEARVHHNSRTRSTYKIVNYHTASRNGEPFEEVIKKYGLPNKSYPHCTRELKLGPMDSYMRDNGIKNKALGIRYDEPRRYKPTDTKWYPLVDWWPTTKQEVLDFWKKQPFDLMIPEHYGNCSVCFKKSLNKLLTIAKERPEYFMFFLNMEAKYSDLKIKEGYSDGRKIFRGHLSVVDILAMSNGTFEGYIDPNWDTEECADECGTVEN